MNGDFENIILEFEQKINELTLIKEEQEKLNERQTELTERNNKRTHSESFYYFKRMLILFRIASDSGRRLSSSDKSSHSDASW